MNVFIYFNLLLNTSRNYNRIKEMLLCSSRRCLFNARSARIIPIIIDDKEETKEEKGFNMETDINITTVSHIALLMNKIYPIRPIEYIMKFDGCSKGNPGPSGAGAVIYKNNEEIWGGCHFVGEKQTNNYAEYSGIILGMQKALNMGITRIHIYGDSNLVVKQLSGEFRVKSPSLFSIYTVAKDLTFKFEEIKINHIYRADNARADELANLALEYIPDPENSFITTSTKFKLNQTNQTNQIKSRSDSSIVVTDML